MKDNFLAVSHSLSNGARIEGLKKLFLKAAFQRVLMALTLCLLASDCVLVIGADLAQRRAELRTKFDSALSETRERFGKDRTNLGGKYVAALQRIEADLQAKGDLQELLSVRKEREMFIYSGTLSSGGSPEMSRMRTLYTEALAPIEKNEREEITRLTEAYLGQLEALKVELTREGDIETAVKVNEEIEATRNRLKTEGDVSIALTPAAPASPVPGNFEPIPVIQSDPVGTDLFKQDNWPLKVALPQANYKIEGFRKVEGEKGREILLMSGSLFRGAGKDPRWLLGQSTTLVAREVKFDGFTFQGDLGSRFYFENCQFKDMNLGKGGGWFGGRFMSRWQFRECRIEGTFAEEWQSNRFGLQMVNCEVERVKFPSIIYHKDDEPSELARQDWATVKDTHFRKCVIPVSVLSLLSDCTFEDCRFVDDPAPLTFAATITRTLYLENCQWNVKALPAGLVIEQKKLSEKP